jgi:hypothetical protein
VSSDFPATGQEGDEIHPDPSANEPIRPPASLLPEIFSSGDGGGAAPGVPRRPIGSAQDG